MIIYPNRINRFIYVKKTQRVYCVQESEYVERNPKFVQLVKKSTSFYWTQKFINVITNTIADLKNPMCRKILHYPVNFAKGFEVNSFLPNTWMQKPDFVKYYLYKFRPLNINMGILERVYEVPSEICHQKKSQVPLCVCGVYGVSIFRI